MKILVAGGAGYIGSHAVRYLRQAGHEVWVYDNLSRGHREAVPAECLIEGEPQYRDIESIVETAWKWHSTHPRGYAT